MEGGLSREEYMQIRCVVAGYNRFGEPAFFGTVVQVDTDSYEAGLHYDVARADARAAGYEPGVVYDDYDGVPWLFENVFA